MRRIQRPSLYAVCVLMSLLLTGCGLTSPQRIQSAPQPTKTPTPTLTWAPVTTPESVQIAHAGWAVSPVDGHDAWLCASGSAGQFAVWATQDAGVSWKQVGTFSYATPGLAYCTLVADQASADSLAATVTWGSGEAGDLQSASVYSSDGGAHWTQAPVIRELVTGASGVLALTSTGLAVSTDGFQTWRALPSVPLASDDQLFRFWLAADSSTLIAASMNNTLWRTDDLGAHWTKVATPSQQTELAVWLNASHAFYMCGWIGGQFILIQCSDDMGAHWSSVQAETVTCSACGGAAATQTNSCPPWSIAPDGSLLAACWDSTSAPKVASVYRLASHSDSWQLIGTSPGTVDLVPATGPVWCVTTSGDATTGMDTTTLPF